MNNVYLFLITISVLTQCQSPTKQITPVQFTINSFDVANNNMDVTFSITNPTENTWEGGAWSLHWNSIFGELITESLPEGIEYT